MVLSVSRNGNRRSEVVTRVTVNNRAEVYEEHCKKGDVQMTDDQAKNERL